MKKFVLCFLSAFIFLSFLPISSASSANADANKSYYAKIQTAGVNFCSTPSEASALFEIPNSFFVKVEQIVDDFFKVTYKGLEGYVKKDKVSLMNGTPTRKDEVSFQVYMSSWMYKTSSTNETVVLLDNAMPITYYGSKLGQQLQTGNNEWYYSSVEIDGQSYFGYVYSNDHIKDPLIIERNPEVFEIVSEDVLYPAKPSQTFSGLSVGTKVILIVAISVPSILILYFLIKPSKIMQITKTKRKAQTKRIRHGDYFEFDESEL